MVIFWVNKYMNSLREFLSSACADDKNKPLFTLIRTRGSSRLDKKISPLADCDALNI